MSRFEREKISKKVNTLSQVFAGLAGVGIVVIALQLFSGSTGIDLFNIKYSLSNLFSSEKEKTVSAPPNHDLRPNNHHIFEDNSAKELLEAKLKAASFLKNHLQVKSITPEKDLLPAGKNDKRSSKYSIINIPSLKSKEDLYNLELQFVKTGNFNMGILPIVKEARYSRWTVGIHLIPGVSMTRVKYTRFDEISTRTVGNTQYGFYQTQKERNTMNRSLMKYSIGVDLIYRFNKKFSISTGLIYCNSGESVLVKEIQDENINRIAPDQSESFFEGMPDFESPREENAESNLRFANNIAYFEIPLVANYKLFTFNKLTDIELQAGASVTRLDYVNAMVYNFENDGYYLVTGSNPELYQKYGSNAIVGISASKYITNNVQVFANPQIKYGLTNIFNPDYNIKQHYFNAGIRLGMKINL
ncbi:MAG: hypothetical protein H6605_09915 [Flavobacteriales bacterium]|nr:hypothetical protein [Flavobacteriales bacterium]